MASTTSEISNVSAAAATQGSDRVNTDKDTFLKLLIAQMTHQDPLNPTEDKEFVSQLAQFTSVEELQNIRSSVDDLNKTVDQTQIVNALSMIGTLVYAEGDNISFLPGQGFDSEGKADGSDYCSTLLYDLPYNANQVTANVYATDEEGNASLLVYSASLGSQEAGSDKQFNWTGKDNNGNTMPEGTYVVSIKATDSNGKEITVKHRSSGQVMSVAKQDDGNHKLYLTDGRVIYFNDVIRVAPVINSNGTGDSGSGSSGSGDSGSDSSS